MCLGQVQHTSAWPFRLGAGLLAVLLAFCPAVAAQKAGSKTTGAGSKPASAFHRLAERAAAARSAGRLDEAIKLYRQSLRLRPAWQEGWWALGTSCYELKRFTEGRLAFQRLSALEPKAGAAWAMLGLCEFQLREYESALGHLQRGRVRGLGEDAQLQVVTNYHAAILLNRAGQFESAYALLKPRARADEEQDDLLAALGLSVLRLSWLPTEMPPDQRELAVEAGRATFYAETNRPLQARRAYEELKERYPNAPGVRYACGVYLLCEYPDEAIADFRRELSISPGHVQARLQIALEHLKRNEPNAGLPLAEEAVKLAPRAAPAHYALGRLQFALGQVKRAVIELEAAARLAPDSAEIWFALARAYGRAGRKQAAARARAEFLRLDKLRSSNTR